MSGFIVACARHDPAGRYRADAVEACGALLVPPGIESSPTRTYSHGGLVIAVVNPVDGIEWKDASICLGRVYGDCDTWHLFGGEAPDGSYALIRAADRALEIVTDVVASRTVWYVLSEQVFLASTSQRALVALLGGFRPNDRATSWMLSAGSLGPEHSWDTRLHRLPANAHLTLGLDSWSVEIRESPVAFEPETLTAEAHVGRFREAIVGTCSELNVPLSHWWLPLSGGLDSRALLMGLVAAGQRPRCITWGRHASLSSPDSDACVAAELANTMSVAHRYVPLDIVGGDVASALDHFVLASEGRVEDFAAYTDDFAMWRSLFAEGTHGVIRGDEPGFGHGPCHDPTYIRRKLGGVLARDYAPSSLIRQLGLTEQTWPQELNLQPGESLVAYRDRLGLQYENPATFAPLNGVKARYVEVVNPLQSRRIVDVSRRLPDSLRVGRTAFQAAVESLSPPVRYATEPATAPPEDFLSGGALLREVRQELRSSRAERVLPRRGLNRILAELEKPASTRREPAWRSAAKRMVPPRIAQRLSPRVSPSLPANRLAFRAFIASRAAAMFEEDAKTLKRRRAPASSAS